MTYFFGNRSQDDLAVEAMLCLVDIHTGLEYFSLKTASVLDLDPVGVFHSYMGRCNWDTSVIVDFLVSNETCFLLYLLKMLKSLGRVGLPVDNSKPFVDH